jgi:hypothetical protein
MGCLAALSPDAVFANTNSVLFSDDFNRANSNSVGNGWNSNAQLPGILSILDGALADIDPSGLVAAVYRPLSYTGSITISADLSHESGFGGLPLRYQTVFSVKDDGTGNGYGIKFDRGDANSQSFIELFDNGVVVGVLESSFQFGPAMHASITFNLDGSVSGMISQQGDNYAFSFPARIVASSGANFSIQMGEYFVGPNQSIIPSVDNLVITGVSASPAELVQNLINDIVSADLSRGRENSYFAQLKNTHSFIERGQIISAFNQLKTLERKIEQDFSLGNLSQQQHDSFIAQISLIRSSFQ